MVDEKTGKVLKSDVSVSGNLITFTSFAPPKSSIGATASIADKDMEKRLVILQKSMQIQLEDTYSTEVQSEPFEVTIGKKVKFSIQTPLKDVTIAIKKRASKNQNWEEFKTIQSDITDKTSFTFNGKYDYDVSLTKKGYELSTVQGIGSNGDITFTVSILKISQLDITITDDN